MCSTTGGAASVALGPVCLEGPLENPNCCRLMTVHAALLCAWNTILCVRAVTSELCP